jgi:hypothetical protein
MKVDAKDDARGGRAEGLVEMRARGGKFHMEVAADGSIVVVEILTQWGVGGTKDRKVVQLAKYVTGRDGRAEESEILKGGGEGVELGNSSGGAKDGGGVQKKIDLAKRNLGKARQRGAEECFCRRRSCLV